MPAFRRGLVIVTLAAAAACAERGAPRTTPARVAPRVPAADRTDATARAASHDDDSGVVGLASFYGAAFEGRKTASGRVFDKEELVAAHPSYPFGTRLRVINLENGRSVVVSVVDRGPSNDNIAEGVIIDLSERAAQVLGFIADGRQRVRLVVLEWGRAGT
jgi:rare lipoprotein A